MFCKHCGNEILDDALVCTKCGCGTDKMNEKTSRNTTTEGQLSQKGWFLALMCYLFGAFGVHRFLVGKTGTGILWALTFGCFGVGALVDFITILCGKFTDKNGKEIPLGL